MESIGRPLVITLGKNDHNYYEIYEEEYSAIFLGAWKNSMAPPSLLEFIISLVIAEGIFHLIPEDNSEPIAHLGTKGCIGDFNATLKDVRYKVLNGFICNSCSCTIRNAIGIEKFEVWKTILKKEWFGSAEDPLSPASIVKKLGYDLFATKGYTPSFWEKTKSTLSEDGIKEFVKLIALIIGTALLIWLNLKKAE